jgi:hypothetical protein
VARATDDASQPAYFSFPDIALLDEAPITVACSRRPAVLDH